MSGKPKSSCVSTQVAQLQVKEKAWQRTRVLSTGAKLACCAGDAAHGSSRPELPRSAARSFALLSESWLLSTAVLWEAAAVWYKVRKLC